MKTGKKNIDTNVKFIGLILSNFCPVTFPQRLMESKEDPPLLIEKERKKKGQLTF